ncbi:MAG: hypothetical protein C4338_05500 [Rhodanobacteraceae bacterium]
MERVRTAKPAQWASVKEGPGNGMSGCFERVVESGAFASCGEAQLARRIRGRQDADRNSRHGWLLAMFANRAPRLAGAFFHV